LAIDALGVKVISIEGVPNLFLILQKAQRNVEGNKGAVNNAAVTIISLLFLFIF